MNKQKHIVIFVLCVLLLVGCQTTQSSNNTLTPQKKESVINNNAPERRFPGVTWQQYANSAEAGWSSARLTEAKNYADSIGSAAVMLIHDGVVVAAWGELDRRFMSHSIRKSLLHALYGIHLEQKNLNLQQTLAQLHIDDISPLTQAEKQATILDLLTARSGVYHPAAYETRGWQEKRPSRGSYAHGTYWYYNNWDFNALLTIFEQETHTHIFDEFQTRIATPCTCKIIGHGTAIITMSRFPITLLICFACQQET